MINDVRSCGQKDCSTILLFIKWVNNNIHNVTDSSYFIVTKFKYFLYYVKNIIGLQKGLRLWEAGQSEQGSHPLCVWYHLNCSGSTSQSTTCNSVLVVLVKWVPRKLIAFISLFAIQDFKAFGITTQGCIMWHNEHKPSAASHIFFNIWLGFLFGGRWRPSMSAINCVGGIIVYV